MELTELAAQARPYRYRLALIALSTLAASIATLAIPWLAGQVIGRSMMSGGSEDYFLVALLVSALVSVAAASVVTSLTSAATAARILADLRKRIFDHVIGLPLEFHDQGRQGDTLALMTYEISYLSQFMTGTLATLPAIGLTTLGASVMLFRLDPALAFLIPALVPAFYLLLKLVGRRLRFLAIQRQEAEANLFASVEENLEMLPAIKAFTNEKSKGAHYGDLAEQARKLYCKEASIYAVVSPLIGAISAIAAVLLVVLASRKVANGALPPGDMFSFLLYAALLTRPVSMLANVYGQIQTARGTLARLRNVLHLPTEVSPRDAIPLGRASGKIQFTDIRFSYPGREQVLSGASMQIDAGEIVALLGENGAGKSTFVNLLLRFYLPSEGLISLDDRDISTIALSELRQQIGYVPQRPLLFNGTIHENIAFGLEGAGVDAVRSAARLSQADEFIMALPQGYDTTIGDHGVRLSGGQRQRIALARALLKDPPILILDEATSMYDLKGEAAFVETCKSALVGRTVILITHRPASLALANRVLHLSNGTISSQETES